MQLRNLLMNIEVYCLSVNLVSHSMPRTYVYETVEYSRRKVSSLQYNSTRANYMVPELAVIKRERERESNENYSRNNFIANISVKLNAD